MVKARDTRVKVLSELVKLSNSLGRHDSHFAILGEGNTSSKIDTESIAGSFLVKVSGTQLATVAEKDFVEVNSETIMQFITMENPDANDIQNILEEAKVDKNNPAMPSIETLLHAICLSLEGVNFVGHTHPTALNMLTCSKSFPENLKGRVSPIEVLLLGKESIFIRYMDPGVRLGMEVKKKLDIFLDRQGERPKSIYMQNHGFVALGHTAIEVEDITAMADKTAKIRLGALLAGGINTLSDDIVEDIAGMSVV